MNEVFAVGTADELEIASIPFARGECVKIAIGEHRLIR